MSPDTDVYHIALLLSCVIHKERVIQLCPINSRELKMLNITIFIKALMNDPDLADINDEILAKIKDYLLCNWL